MNLSVVIPTYNRSEMLGRALRGLLEQSLPAAQYEIIVVDDGSTDNTRQVVEEIGAPESRLRYFRQENKGPAAARNYGTREARGEIILFTGDDCLPDRRLLEEHVRTHVAEGDVGVIGYVGWHPELEITPFMVFLEDGVQFGFGHIKDPENAPAWAFYTSNCSVRKRRLVEVGGFDEDFRAAAFEDIELAHRLKQRGLVLVYRAEAITYHHHATTLERYLGRQREAGKAAVTFWRKHPEMREELVIDRAATPQAVSDMYGTLVAYAYSMGIREAIRGDGVPEEDESTIACRDPKLVADGRAWIREVFGQEDPRWEELIRLRAEVRELHRSLEERDAQWARVTSRRLYRMAESLGNLAWRVVRLVRPVRRRREQ